MRDNISMQKDLYMCVCSRYVNESKDNILLQSRERLGWVEEGRTFGTVTVLRFRRCRPLFNCAAAFTCGMGKKNERKRRGVHMRERRRQKKKDRKRWKETAKTERGW